MFTRAALSTRWISQGALGPVSRPQFRDNFVNADSHHRHERQHCIQKKTRKGLRGRAAAPRDFPNKATLEGCIWPVYPCKFIGRTAASVSPVSVRPPHSLTPFLSHVRFLLDMQRRLRFAQVELIRGCNA